MMELIFFVVFDKGDIVRLTRAGQKYSGFIALWINNLLCQIKAEYVGEQR